MLAADSGADALRAGFRALAALGLPRLIDIVTVPAEGPTDQLLREVLQPNGGYEIRGRSQWPVAHFSEEAPSEPSHVLDVIPHHRSGSTKKNVKRHLRGLERELEAPLALRERSDDPQVIEDFLTLQAAGWKGDASKRGEAYRVTGREQWLREVAARYRARGEFSAIEIRAEGRPLYVILGFRTGDTVFALQDAYDEVGAKYGLGSLGRTAYMNWVAAQGVRTFDPNMFWGYVDSARLFPHRREQVRLLIAASSGMPKRQLAAFRAAKELRGRARSWRTAVQKLSPGRDASDPASAGP